MISLADSDEGRDADSDVEQLEHLSALLAESSEFERRSLLAAARALGLPDWPQTDQDLGGTWTLSLATQRTRPQGAFFLMRCWPWWPVR